MKHLYKSLWISTLIVILCVNFCDNLPPLIAIASRIATFARSSRLLRYASQKSRSIPRSSSFPTQFTRSTSFFSFSESPRLSGLLPPNLKITTRSNSLTSTSNSLLRRSNKRSYTDIKQLSNHHDQFRTSFDNPLLNKDWATNKRRNFVRPDLVNNNAALYEGIGGNYRTLSKFVSSKVIEVDHFPATSLYKYSPEFKNLKYGQQPAVSLTKRLHKQTASWGKRETSKQFRSVQRKLIEQNKWKEALEMSIKDYQNLAGHDLNTGIRQALNVHRRVGTINKIEYKELVNKYKLKYSTKRAYNLVTINNEKILMSKSNYGIESAKTNNGIASSTSIRRGSVSDHLRDRKTIGKDVMRSIFNKKDKTRNRAVGG